MVLSLEYTKGLEFVENCPASVMASVEPVVATLLMSLESVISVLGGWLVLGQTLTLREMGGCAVIFLAVLLAQLAPVRKP